jgi:hypothetical protein
MQIEELIHKSGFILLPPHAINSLRSLTLEGVEAVALQSDVEMVEQGSEPLLFLSFATFRTPSSPWDMRSSPFVESMFD